MLIAANGRVFVVRWLLAVTQHSFDDRQLANASPRCGSKGVSSIIAEGVAAGELRQGDAFIAAIAFTGVILRAVELKLSGVLERPLAE